MQSNAISLFGNRQSRATPERLECYRYDPESGRLRQRAPGRAYEYDAGGRTTEDGRWRYCYGAQGRLAEITRATTGQRQAAYRYNALGERARKLGTSVTYYHYDLEGRLLAETDAGGQTRAGRRGRNTCIWGMSRWRSVVRASYTTITMTIWGRRKSSRTAPGRWYGRQATGRLGRRLLEWDM